MRLRTLASSISGAKTMLLQEVSNAEFAEIYAQLGIRLQRGDRYSEVNYYLRTVLKNALPDTQIINQADGKSFLHQAVLQDDREVIHFLLSHDAAVDIQDKLGNTPLYYACVWEREQAVDLLLKHHANPNTGVVGDTPLFAIIKAKQLDQKVIGNIVGNLIHFGADINQQGGVYRFSPLHLAVMHRKLALVQVIVNTKLGLANLDLKDIDGRTVLHAVAAYRSTAEQGTQNKKMKEEKEIAKFIINYVDAINIQDKWGDTPLHLAVVNGNVEIVRLFLKKDYLFSQEKILNIKNNAGMTVIHEAARRPGRGNRILNLLLSMATQTDLEIENNQGETVSNMVDRLIKTPEIVNDIEVLTLSAESLTLIAQGLGNKLLSNDRELLLTLARRLAENSRHVYHYAERLADDTEAFAAASELPDHVETLAAETAEFFIQIQELLMDTEQFAASLGSVSETAKHLSLRAKKIAQDLKQLFSDGEGGVRRNKIMASYIRGLNNIKNLLEQVDYFSWKNRQLKLPSSFPTYTEILQDNFYRDYPDLLYKQASEQYHAGIAYFDNREYQQAIRSLKESVRLYQQRYPRHLALANAHFYLAVALFHAEQSTYQAAQTNIEDSITIYYNLKHYASLEIAYQFLADIFIYADQAFSHEKAMLNLVQGLGSSHKEKLCAHLALAGLYKALKEQNILYSPLIKFAQYESFHYSEAYKFMQGPLDDDADVVLQREIGIANNRNIGTYNIQQCVAVVAYDASTKKVVLSHFDRFSGPLTFIQQIIKQFPGATRIALYLSGGRDRSETGRQISDNNIDQVLKQIYSHREKFVIQAADLGDKASPPAIVFDVQSARLVHRTPNRFDISLTSRRVAMTLQLVKDDYLRPLNKVDFSATDVERQIIFSPHEQQFISEQYHRYSTQAMFQTQSWRYNQILYPLISIVHDIVGSTSFNRPILANFVQNPPTNADFMQLQMLLHTFSQSSVQSPRENINFDLVSVLFNADNPMIAFPVQPIRDSAFARRSTANPNKKTRLDPSVQIVEAYDAFEQETARGNFNYWLQYQDIADIARIVFASYRTQTNNGRFVVVSDLGDNFARELQDFKAAMLLPNHAETGRLSFIINLSGMHWVTLVVHYQQDEFNQENELDQDNGFSAFYMDSMLGMSLKDSIPQEIARVLQYFAIKTTNLSFLQQEDDVNCGLWALENTDLINKVLDNNNLFQWLASRENDAGEYTSEYFRERRQYYASLLRQDESRINLIDARRLAKNYLPVACFTAGKRKKRNTDKCLFVWDEFERLADRFFLNTEADFFAGSTRNLLVKLLDARQRGVVVAVANLNAIVLAMAKMHSTPQKLVITDANMPTLEAIRYLLYLAEVASSETIWLRQVKRKFPVAGRLLAQQRAELAQAIDFTSLKKALSGEQIYFLPMSFTAADNSLAQILHQELANGEISAIYLSNQEFSGNPVTSAAEALEKSLAFKNTVLALLDENTEVYRRKAPFSGAITRYQGTKSAIAQAWTLPTFTALKTDKLALTQEARTMRDSLGYLQAAKTWQHTLNLFVNLAADWIPILATAKPIAGGKEEMHFINRNTQAERIMTLPGRTSVHFLEKLQNVYQGLHGILKFATRYPEQTLGILFNFKKETSTTMLESTIVHADTVNGLNAAFTIQALFAFFQQQQSREHLRTERGPLLIALEIHSYVKLMQMGHGSAMDAAKIVSLVKTLLYQESVLAQKPLSVFTRGFSYATSEGVSAPFAVANIALDIIELAKARTEAETDLFATQLSFDSSGLALSLAGTGAGFLGFSGVGAGLSALSVPVMGVGIGTTALVQSFSQVAAKAEAVGAYFFQLDYAYKNHGYEAISSNAQQTFMRPLFGAVIVEIDFQNNSLRYASPYLYRSHPDHTGSGKINYFFWEGDFPTVLLNKTQALNIRDRLGYPQQILLGSWQACTTWILPMTPKSYIKYQWANLPGATSRKDKGFSVLRTLERQEDFDYDFYIFPSEYTITRIDEERVATSITIRLDEQQRSFFIPKLAESDRELYSHIHYFFEGSIIQGGQCFLGLNEIGSIQLLERQADYTWILSAESLADDTVSFTDSGITLGSLAIKIPQHQAQYYFIDKQQGRFRLDFSRRTAVLMSIDFDFLQKQHLLVKDYVHAHVVSQSMDSIVTLDHFSLQDEHERAYQGKAFYSLTEDKYFYTQNMPKNITDEASLVYFDNDSAYFFYSPQSLFWRTNSKTYHLEKNYVFFSKFIKNYPELTTTSYLIAKNITSITVQENGITVTQAFTLHDGADADANAGVKRYAIYQLVEDSPILHSLQEDELLQILQVYHQHMNSALQATARNSWKKNLQKICAESIFNGEIPSDAYPRFAGGPALPQWHSLVHILPFSPANNLPPLWLRKTEHECQLIVPQISQKKVIFLGSLFTFSQQEVFYFFLPASRTASATLFRQLAGDSIARAMDLAITQAFFSKNMLFVLTYDQVLKTVNALGATHTISITAEWTQQHANWWQAIPTWLEGEENIPGEKLISVFGMTDQAGQALAVWYDTEEQEFILFQPHHKKNGQPVQTRYLGKLADHYFFFCEDKTLHQQTTQPAMSVLFKARQLQADISSQRLNARGALIEAYLHKQRLWIHTKTGLLFSLDPQQAETHFLEKIYYQWLHSNTNCIDVYETMVKDALQQKKPLRLRESEWFKLCLLYSVTDFSINGTCIPMDPFTTDLCCTAPPNALIPIEDMPGTTTHWWNAEKDLFFMVPADKDGSEWLYLGTVSSNAAACFFSAQEKLTYIIPGDTTRRSKKTYQTLATELVAKFNASALFLLAPLADYKLIPLLDGIKTLGLQFSAEVPVVFSISAALMNHYQTIIYQQQIHSMQPHALEFAKEGGDFFVASKQQDIIIFHTHTPCQFVLAHALLDEDQPNAWHKTSICIVDAQQNSTCLYKTSIAEISRRLKNALLSGVGQYMPLLPAEQFANTPVPTAHVSSRQQAPSIRLQEQPLSLSITAGLAKLKASNNTAYAKRPSLLPRDAAKAKWKSKFALAKLDVQETLQLATVAILKLTRQRFFPLKSVYTLSLAEAQIYAVVIAEKVVCLVEAAANEAKVILLPRDEELAWQAEETLRRQLYSALVQQTSLEKVIIHYINLVYLTPLDESQKVAILSAIHASLVDDRQDMQKGNAAKTVASSRGPACFYTAASNREHRLPQARNLFNLN
jgi:ankyrin repeat protein